MDDMNACAECGYTTNNFMEFLKHIDEHEKEKIIVVDDDTKDSNDDGQNNGDISPSTSPSGSNSNSSSENNIQTKMVSSFSVSSMLADSSGPDSPLNLSAISTPSVTNSPATTTGRSEKHMHSCPHCNFTTYMSQHMKSHLEAHERHQGQMFQCDICQMQFSQKANMHRHRMRHSGVKPYQCRFCLKKFFRKDQMQEHSMTHIKTGDDFDCPVALCPHKFSQHSALRAHLEETHTITPNSQASCKRCSLMFSNSRRLLLHYQTKHDDAEAILSRAAIKQGLTQNLDIDTALQLLSNSTQGKLPRPPIKRRRMTPLATVSISSSAPTSVITSTSSVITSVPAIKIEDEAMPMDLAMKIAADLRSKTASPEKNGNVAIKSEKPESPKLLPKAESPVYANVLTNGFKQLSHQDLLMSLANPIFNLPKPEPTHMHMQLWTNEANSTTTTTIDDHSSTHSPSADSRSSTSNISQENDDLLKERLECTHCGVIFLDQTMYLLHKGLHSESDPWKCNLCGHGCGDKYMFTTHVISSDHN